MFKSKILYLILFIFLIFVSCFKESLPEEQLASDAEMIWCVSNAEYVEAGSYMIFTGWASVRVDKSQRFEGDEATKAKDLYRTLYSTIEYYDFNEDNTNFTVINDKDQMLSDIESSWVEGKVNQTAENGAQAFIERWPKYKSWYETSEDDLQEFYMTNYVNTYSICKLWYDANN